MQSQLLLLLLYLIEFIRLYLELFVQCLHLLQIALDVRVQLLCLVLKLFLDLRGLRQYVVSLVDLSIEVHDHLSVLALHIFALLRHLLHLLFKFTGQLFFDPGLLYVALSRRQFDCDRLCLIRDLG